MRYGKFSNLYIRFCNPGSQEYAEFLRRHGNFYAIGENCTILPETMFTDPAYVRIGNNVHFSSCTVIGHDGSIAGVPARPIGRVSDLVKKLQAETQSWPWADLINNREGCFDPEIEEELLQLRVSHFYRNTSTPTALQFK